MKNYYIRLEMALMRDKSYSQTEKMLLGILFALTKKGESETSVTNRYLAINLGISPHTASIVLKKLKERSIRLQDYSLPLINISKNEYKQRSISFDHKIINWLLENNYLTKKGKKNERN